MTRRIFSRVGRFVLVVGACLLSAHLGITPAAAAPKEDPFLGVTPNWDKNLPSASRFTVLSAFGGAAVRDNNTGLVWEQAPDATPHIWTAARPWCLDRAVGGTRGWRLPSVVELMSLLDPSVPLPSVPTAVFTFVTDGTYWSATTNATSPTDAFTVLMLPGSMGHRLESHAKDRTNLAWCVRGPMNTDTY